MYDTETAHDWITTIFGNALSKKLKDLCDDELEILTLGALEDYT